jgi:gliding motility-associated protein GldC
MNKISNINFQVELDENRVPTKIEWEATDAGFEGKKECSSMMIALWDTAEKVTFGLDLWTKDMLVYDLNKHFHQVFLKMADTYLRATKNSEIADMINNFSADFLERINAEAQNEEKLS